MESPVLNVAENSPRLRVSVIIRLVAALAYTIPLIGGALSSLETTVLMTVDETHQRCSITSREEQLVPRVLALVDVVVLKE